MPLDVRVEYTNGKIEWIHIPLRIMRGEKSKEQGMENFRVVEDWPWTHPTYKLVLKSEYEGIKSIEIDPSRRMADVKRENNFYPKIDDTQFIPSGATK